MRDEVADTLIPPGHHPRPGPATIGLRHPDAECDLDYTAGEPVDREIRLALSNAFGFGGHNTTLVFRRWER